ncbi:helix-turn-helix domain-containing protein [Aliiglaciecola sp. 3_MG-2023]|uniref:helix-turn-helix domain-containing protein n=1 Tax=Aliiglaciecola sp. 3_MG-2023 TaxID=3062644 RepID=UPI0026E3458A|nr:helix-turn-helix domain-containing protein [Aliiglaciecola sp. 3_MG-2023]MDO6692656.1 helix-turn-helix domain-containing protein [Aliiglaciecola sp. 3_MG-2023]
MKSWKLVPKNDLVLKYVECYWFLEKEAHDSSHTNPKLNPDPSAHLILADNHHIHEYNQEVTSHLVQGDHWIFPHLKTFTMDHSSHFKILGIKFRVGALYSLNLSDFSASLDNVVEANIRQLLGEEQSGVEVLSIDAAYQSNEVRNILDEVLETWFSTTHEDKHSTLVRQILPLLNHTPIADIGNILHRSQRTLERSFLKVTQLTMKQCQSMIRLESILDYLYQRRDNDINWADVASKWNFSDQPHFIRFLKGAIDSTPAEYDKSRDLTIDIYGNFEFN